MDKEKTFKEESVGVKVFIVLSMAFLISLPIAAIIDVIEVALNKNDKKEKTV